MGPALLTPLTSPPMSSLGLSSRGLLASSQSPPRGSIFVAPTTIGILSYLSSLLEPSSIRLAAGLGCLPGWLGQSLAQSRPSINVCGNKCSSWVVRTPYFSLHCVSKSRSSTKSWGQLEDVSPGSCPGRALQALNFLLSCSLSQPLCGFPPRRESEISWASELQN